MRVLMVSQFYAPVVGGQERMVENLVRSLVNRGHDGAVVTLAHPGLPASEVRDGVQIHRVRGTLQRAGALFRDPRRRHAPPLPDPETVAGIRRVIAIERPDVLHAHDWMAASAAVARGSSDIPLLLSLHDHGFVCANKRMMRGGDVCDGPGLFKCCACAARQYGTLTGPAIVGGVRAIRPVLRRAVDGFLPVSRAVAEGCGLDVNHPAVHVIPNFLPASTAGLDGEDEGSVEGLPAGQFIAFAGDATQDKGIDVLLDAHRRLGSEPPLVVVGRPETAALELPPPNVVVLGPRPHDEVLRVLRRSTVVVVPSICAESFGLVALEAMAMGRPVIASRSGALPDLVVDGETGLLVRPGDPSDLANGLRSLLDQPGRIAEMGRAGRLRAGRYSEAVVVSQVEAVYAAALAARRTKTGRVPA